MDEREYRKQLEAMVSQKIADGTLPKELRVTLTDDNGQSSSVTQEVTDPKIYLDHLFARKRMIKGTYQSDISILRSVAKEDLRISEEDHSTATPEELPDLKISDIVNGTSNFCVKGRVFDSETKVTQPKDGKSYNITTLIIGDGTGEIDVSVFYDQSVDHIFQLAQSRQIIGKTVYLTNVRAQENDFEKNKYATFPVSIKMSKNISTISVLEEEMRVTIRYIPLRMINEATKFASIRGKIIRVGQPKAFTTAAGRQSSSIEFDMIDTDGSSITLKGFGDIVRAIPPVNTVVAVKFARAEVNKYRKDHPEKYTQPVMLVVSKPSNIMIERDVNASEYPDQIVRQVNTTKALKSANDGELISVIGYISNLHSDKWDATNQKFMPKRPYYIACQRIADAAKNRVCNKGIQQLPDGTYTCPTHGNLDPNEMAKRLIISAEFNDGSGSCEITLFHDTAAVVTGQPSEKIVADYDATDHNEYFNYLNAQIVLSSLAFKIVGRPSMGAYRPKIDIVSIEPVSYNDAANLELASIRS